MNLYNLKNTENTQEKYCSFVQTYLPKVDMITANKCLRLKSGLLKRSVPAHTLINRLACKSVVMDFAYLPAN